MRRVRARVTGKVQGVGFRWFVTREARSLQLAGWVRNLPDGSVQLEAEGPLDRLDDLLLALRRGPVGSRVESVLEDGWQEVEGGERGFEIRG